MLQPERESAQRFNQRDFLLDVQIVADTFENVVRRLLQNNHNVAGLLVRCLVAFTAQDYLLIISHAFFDPEIQTFFLDADFLAATIDTEVFLRNEVTYA